MNIIYQKLFGKCRHGNILFMKFYAGLIFLGFKVCPLKCSRLFFGLFVTLKSTRLIKIHSLGLLCLD